MLSNTILVFTLSLICQASADGFLSSLGTYGGAGGGDVLGVVDFMIDQVEKPHEITGTIVTIGINKHEHDGDDFGGKIRVIWGFDAYNNVLGSSDLDTRIRHNEDQKDIVIHQTFGQGVQAPLISIIAGDDEVCIQFVAATFPHEPTQYAWTGDIGARCGQAWHYGSHSGLRGNVRDTGAPWYPKCTWMDTDGGADISYEPARQPITLQQMKINIISYSGQQNGTNTTDWVCGSTIFSNDARDPIDAQPPRGFTYDNPTGQYKKRGEAEPLIEIPQRPVRPRSQRSADHLIVNSRPSQSAVTLCTSPTSRGSDFVSTDEGLFCDMETKTLYPLCDDKTTLDCFNLEEEELELRMRERFRLGTRQETTKRYRKISYWD